MPGRSLGETAIAMAVEVEQSEDMEAVCKTVKKFARPLGYDRFALYATPPPGPWHRRQDPLDGGGLV